MSDNINEDRRKLINKERVSTVIHLDLGDAQKAVTIPFVLTVMSSLSGTAASRQPSLDKRKLHRVLSRDNFNDLFIQFTPELTKGVKNALPGAEGDLKINLKFKSMKDFEDMQRIIEQVPALKAYFAERTALQRIKDMAASDDASKQALAKLQLDPAVKRALTGN